MYIFSSSRTLFKSTCALQLNSLRYFANKMGLPRVFFDMAADGQALGRIVMEVSRSCAYYRRKFALKIYQLRKKMCISHRRLQNGRRHRGVSEKLKVKPSLSHSPHRSRSLTGFSSLLFSRLETHISLGKNKKINKMERKSCRLISASRR